MGRRAHIVARAALVAGALAATSSTNATGAGPIGHGRMPAPAPCRNANLRPTPLNLPAMATATTCLINRLRHAHHMTSLHANHVLQTVASGQSREMVLGDYFGDNTRSGATPLQRIVAADYLRGASTASTGQNIGWGTGRYATPAGIVRQWLDSPPHRQIMLSGEYRDVGVGVAPSAPATLAAGQPGATYTVDFAARG